MTKDAYATEICPAHQNNVEPNAKQKQPDEGCNLRHSHHNERRENMKDCQQQKKGNENWNPIQNKQGQLPIAKKNEGLLYAHLNKQNISTMFSDSKSKRSNHGLSDPHVTKMRSLEIPKVTLHSKCTKRLLLSRF